MPNNHFITGMPKSGKTTLLTKLVTKMKAQGLRVGGFLSPQVKTHGTRTGFVVQDIGSGRTEVLASVDIDGPKVAKYHVDIKSFESLALPVLRNALRYDVIVIDEIGRMEMKSTKFGDVLADIFESETPIIATLHRDYIEDFQAWGEVLMLTPSSREQIYSDLLEKVVEIKAAKSAKSEKGKAKSKGKEKSGGKEKKEKPGKKSKNPAPLSKKTKSSSKNKKAFVQKLSDKRKEWVSAAKEKAKSKRTSSRSHEDFDKIADDIHRHHKKKDEKGESGKKDVSESELSNREHEHHSHKAEQSTLDTEHRAHDTGHGTQDTRPETQDTEPEHHKRGWRKWVKEHVGV